MDRIEDCDHELELLTIDDKTGEYVYQDQCIRCGWVSKIREKP